MPPTIGGHPETSEEDMSRHRKTRGRYEQLARSVARERREPTHYGTDWREAPSNVLRNVTATEDAFGYRTASPQARKSKALQAREDREQAGWYGAYKPQAKPARKPQARKATEPRQARKVDNGPTERELMAERRKAAGTIAMGTID